jgi:5-methylcytosine-specific restriction endonuclease McrA
MKLELFLLALTYFIVGNIHNEGLYLKMIYDNKKYFHMAGVILGAIVIYWLLKKNPHKTSEIIKTSNEYIKYLPVDKDTSSILTPIFDITSKGYSNGLISGGNNNNVDNLAEQRIKNSGIKQGTKRSVSETKKKYVASNQNWKCGDCTKQLNAWFEIDHKIRLEHGGSNHIDNLVALCRECHGKKTTIENL